MLYIKLRIYDILFILLYIIFEIEFIFNFKNNLLNFFMS
jgi:hypothetical protein